MAWWTWLAVAFGLLAVLAVVAIIFRVQLLFAIRFARTLATDKRVPRPIRWLIGVSLVIKVVPFPDFGLDEVVLLGVGVVLVVFYRPVLRAIYDETRARRDATEDRDLSIVEPPPS